MNLSRFPHPLCLLGLHRWTLSQVLDDRLAQILFGVVEASRWQEVCARRGCTAKRPIQQQDMNKQSTK